MLREDLGMAGHTEEQHLSDGSSQISNTCVIASTHCPKLVR